MSDIDCEQLKQALAEVGKHPALRERFIEVIREAEKALSRRDFSVRDEVTGPIIDALHGEAGVLRKMLSSGIVFDFHYRSKIAREIVMSPDRVPDHVWEPQTTKLLVHFGKTVPNVIIGGAYAGDQAILVARELARHGGSLHAFEPNGDQIAMLRHNAEINSLSNIVFNRVGLWKDDNTTLRLVGDDSFAHPEVAEAGGAADDTFPTVSINAYGKSRGLDRVGLIMLDIEGAEAAALAGASNYLSQSPDKAPIVVFELHRHYVDWSKGLDQTDIVRFMTGHGYHVYAVRDFNANEPMGDAPIELVPTDRTYLEGPPHGFNMLAVKDPQLIAGPLFKICPDVSPKLLWHRDPKLHHPMTAR